MSQATGDWRHDILLAGTNRAGEEFRDAKDRLVAGDPGLARLRQGIRAFLAVGTTLAVEAGLAAALGQPAVLGMLLGAVVAMLMSTGIREPRRGAVLRTAAGAPFAAAVGATAGVLTAQVTLLGLGAFVLVSFLAVWLRRFGPRGFTYGFLGWQGFFFALFLHPPIDEVPFLIAAIFVAGIWVGLLLTTVLHQDPEARLRRTVTALRARARAGVSAALDVLDDPGELRRVRDLRRQLAQLSEIALLLDGQLADSRALPEGVTPGRLRRWTVDVEIGMDEMARSVVEFAGHSDRIDPSALGEVRTLLEALGWGENSAALTATRDLQASPHGKLPAVRRLTSASEFLLRTVDRWDSGELSSAADPGTASDPLDDPEFEPVVTLNSGNLPGSAALAAVAIGREHASRWSPSRWSLTTRQAVQAAIAAALAIAAGEAISRQRFYWAVIAAFIAFAGTSTSGETLQKSAGRIGGTVAGLVVAVALANVTVGHPDIAVTMILLCIFLAFYFQAVSYGSMIFFITLMLGQLYTVLHTFSDEVLVLRLEETTAGAAIGLLVSILVLPTGSRATLRVARKAFLRSLADLLDACAQVLEGAQPDRDLLVLTVQLDSAARQVVRTRRALTRGRIYGSDRAGLRHRVSILASAGASARTLAGAVANLEPLPASDSRVGAPIDLAGSAGTGPWDSGIGLRAGAAQATHALSALARQLADAAELSHPPPLAPGAPEAAAQLEALLDVADDSPVAPIAQVLLRLGDTLTLLSDHRS